MGDIRKPIKKNAIEKKNKIIEKGFELMCEKGYHNVNCIDIAKYAEVSTGIIYQYFTDKRDIFIEGIKIHSNNIMFPMINILEKNKIKKEDLKELLNEMIDNLTKVHKMSKVAHQQLTAMTHLDEEIGEIFVKNELETTQKFVDMLIGSGFDSKNIKEKVHIIYGMIDNFCHEIVYHKHKDFDYNEMKNEIIDIISKVLN